jgi:hypothetical protein
LMSFVNAVEISDRQHAVGAVVSERSGINSERQGEVTPSSAFVF